MEERIIQYVIDSDLRIIPMLDEGVVLAVVGDNNVKRIWFKMPRYYCGYDMYGFDEIRINYESPDKNQNYYTVTDATSEDDYVVFSWIVSRDIATISGKAHFTVRMINHETGQEFNTTLAEGKILPGLDVTQSVTPEEKEDVLAHLKKDMDDYTDTKKVEYNNLAAEKEAAIEKKGTDTLATIPDDYTEIAKEVTELKEDLATETTARESDIKKLSESKISKFYASSQGGNHLADSDNGKIMDMMIYGKSEQFTTTGKNLLPFPYTEESKVENGITFDVKNDGTIHINGITTKTTYFNLSKDIEWGDKSFSVNNEKYRLIGNTYYNSDNKLLSYSVENGTEIHTVFKPMVVSISETDYTYEPYTGGIPSPNPDYPQEIKRVVNPTVKVSNEDGTQFKTITLPYTLNAIPVRSGGNVTIGGQQYIADYVDVERGKIVRRIGKMILTGEENWSSGFENWGTYPHCVRLENIPNIAAGNTMNTRYLWCEKNANIHINSLNSPYENCIAISDERFSSVEEFKNELKKLVSNGTPLEVYYKMIVPQDEELTSKQIQSLQELKANYPVTNISANSEQLEGYTVFNYPISMKNGWDYVKQQINDNRDYIYNMDAKSQEIETQTAEAYVNSEYAVALAELGGI